jgi:hypothetical protein
MPSRTPSSFGNIGQGTPKPNGGNAFPVTEGAEGAWTHYGMTLRDHFAGEALAPILVAHPKMHARKIAARAYTIADAMIAEQAK